MVVSAAFFFGVAVFLAVAFFGPAFLTGAVDFAGPLVIRPDLVLPSTFSVSTIAGACNQYQSGSHQENKSGHTAAGVLRLLAVLALGFGATAFFAAGTFFGSDDLVFSFFGAPRFLGAAVFAADSFYNYKISQS